MPRHFSRAALAWLLLASRAGFAQVPPPPPAFARDLAPGRLLALLHRPKRTPIRVEEVSVSYSDPDGALLRFAFARAHVTVGFPGATEDLVFRAAWAVPPHDGPVKLLATSFGDDGCGGNRLQAFDAKFLGRLGGHSLVLLDERFEGDSCAGTLDDRRWTRSLILDESRGFQQVYAFVRAEATDGYEYLDDPHGDAVRLAKSSARDATFDPPPQALPPSPEAPPVPALALDVVTREGIANPSVRRSRVTLRWNAAKTRLVESKAARAP